MKAKSILLSIFLGLGLSLAFLALVQRSAGAAPDEPAAVRCVRPGGGGGCFATIQAAVNASVNGDTIRVAQGTYPETVVVTKSLTLQGGWNNTFTEWNWQLFVTVIDANGAGSAIFLSGSPTPITATVEGFHIQGGDASGHLGWGGGILAQGDWLNPGHVTIRWNRIFDNVACRASSCQGYGGGIMIYSNRALIEYNQVISNTARTSGSGPGRGGGIALWGYPTEATLNGNLIEANTAIISPTSQYSAGEGGGLWFDVSSLEAQSNWIRQNAAAVKGEGRGGGVFVSGGGLYGNEIISNTASIDGPGYGGGVYAKYTMDFHDNLVRGNFASQNAAGVGGGVYAIYLRDAHGNTISKNEATRGGGVYYEPYSGLQRFHGNVVTRNIADGLDTGAPDGGGGILNDADWVEITGNHILTNTALAGGGVLSRAGNKILLQNNRLSDNIAVAGGGIYLSNTNGGVLRNQIHHNDAYWWGGGLYLAGASSPRLDGNQVTDNLAAGYSGLASGGVAIAVNASTQVTLTNTIIARNTINSGVASGIHCYSGSCSLIHCTVVDNKLGANPGEGVRISAAGGVNRVWNSIIVGHSTGLTLVGSSPLSADYLNFYNNTVNYSGAASLGPHLYSSDPLFVNRPAGNYRLSGASPMINAADSGMSLPLDFEGDPRAPLPDIGADEFIFGRLFLPLLLNNYTGPHG
jgi:hypothetical protein